VKRVTIIAITVAMLVGASAGYGAGQLGPTSVEASVTKYFIPCEDQFGVSTPAPKIYRHPGTDILLRGHACAGEVVWTFDQDTSGTLTADGSTQVVSDGWWEFLDNGFGDRSDPPGAVNHVIIVRTLDGGACDKALMMAHVDKGDTVAHFDGHLPKPCPDVRGHARVRRVAVQMK
jgi:hypothetical protein